MMDMPTAVKTVFSKYATFSGRAPRSEFWWYTLAILLFTLFLGLVEGIVLAPMLGFELFSQELGQPLRLIAALAFMLPSLAVTVRRLHDIDRSGWWYFVMLIPLVGVCVLLYWEVQPGTDGQNQYG
ncbi:MAG: DUF805 domain-containing protein [Halioglobus sp.]